MKLAFFIFLFFSSFKPTSAQPINEQFYESGSLVRVLRDNLGFIRNHFYQLIIQLNEKDEKYLTAFYKFDEVIKFQQKFASDCNSQAKESCETLLIRIMKQLEQFYESTLPLNEKEMLKLTVETILETQLYFVDYVVKRDGMSLLDRYQSIEVLKKYSLNIYNLFIKGSSKELDSALFDFWKNFVVQSHFILSEDSNLPYFVKNFELLSKSLYGLIYHIQNSNHIDRKVEGKMDLMQNRWNYIQKRLYKPQ